MIVQMKGMRLFVPNRVTHPEFADSLREVVERETGLLVLDCSVTEDCMSVDSFVPFDLSHS
jgi:sugar fermentation stimulation protein A